MIRCPNHHPVHAGRFEKKKKKTQKRERPAPRLGGYVHAPKVTPCRSRYRQNRISQLHCPIIRVKGEAALRMQGYFSNARLRLDTWERTASAWFCARVAKCPPSAPPPPPPVSRFRRTRWKLATFGQRVPQHEEVFFNLLLVNTFENRSFYFFFGKIQRVS